MTPNQREALRHRAAVAANAVQHLIEDMLRADVDPKQLLIVKRTLLAATANIAGLPVVERKRKPRV